MPGRFAFVERRVHILKVPRISYQKRNNYTVIGPDGVRRPANRQMASKVSRPFGFVARTDNQNVLDTGLDEFIDNPYFEATVEDIPIQYRLRGLWEQEWDTIIKQEKITRQTLYEILDNVKKGTYSSERRMPVMGSPTANAFIMRSIEPSDLETFKIHLHEGTNVFENRTKRGRLGILVALHNPKICPDQNYDENYHDFYVASQEEVLAQAEHHDNRFREVVVRLNDVIENYDAFVTYQFAIVCGAVSANVPMRDARSSLNDFIMDQKRVKGYNQTDRWNIFNQHYVKFKDDPNVLYASYLVTEAYIAGIFRDVSGEIIWTTQKGRENLYHLGINRGKVVEAFYQAIQSYDPDLNEDNMYKLLESELASKNILTL